jgi:hypothetical protein
MQQVKTLLDAGYKLSIEGNEIKVKPPPKRLPTGLEAAMFQAIKGNKAAAIQYLSSPPPPVTTTPETTPPPLTSIVMSFEALTTKVLAGGMSERDEAWWITQWQIVAGDRGLIPRIGSDGLPHREWAKELIKQCPV